MTSRAFLALALAIGPLISGCLHASARTVVDSPPLEMPGAAAASHRNGRGDPAGSAARSPKSRSGSRSALPSRPCLPPVPRRAPRRRPDRNRRPGSSRQPSREWPRRFPGPAPTLQTTPAVAEVEVARGIRGHHRPRGRRLEAGQLRGAQRRRPDAVRHGEAVHRSGGRRVDQAKSRARAQPGGQSAGRGGSARRHADPTPSARPPSRRVPTSTAPDAPGMHECQHLAPALKQRHNM